LVVLTISLRTAARRLGSADFVPTLIFLPSTPRPAATRRRPPIPNESAAISIPKPAATPPLPAPVESGAGTSIDWIAEAERAARAAIAAPRARAFGEIPRAPDWAKSAPAPPSPKHEFGEQYRLATGELMVWVSDRCFIVSEPPPLGMPDVIARSLGTRMGCQPPAGPQEGELFKDLPAYKKYHPQ
jgi:hypothetical protein